VLAAYAAFDLCHQVFWQAQVLQGLVQGLRSPLRLAPIAFETLVRLEATTVSGFGLLVGISFAGGQGALLQTVRFAMYG